MHAEACHHVDQRVRAEEVEATAEQVTHAGLRDAQIVAALACVTPRDATLYILSTRQRLADLRPRADAQSGRSEDREAAVR